MITTAHASGWIAVVSVGGWMKVAPSDILKETVEVSEWRGNPSESLKSGNAVSSECAVIENGKVVGYSLRCQVSE